MPRAATLSAARSPAFVPASGAVMPAERLCTVVAARSQAPSAVFVAAPESSGPRPFSRNDWRMSMRHQGLALVPASAGGAPPSTISDAVTSGAT